MKDIFEFKMNKDCLALCIVLARLQLLKEKLAPGTFQCFNGDITIDVEEGEPVTVWEYDSHDSRAIKLFRGP